MRLYIIKAVKYYSKVMFNKDIFVVDSLILDNCKSSSIQILTKDYILKLMINIEYNSLRKISKYLFNIETDEMIEDLQKDIVNIIGGNFANMFFQKDYKLSLPKIEDICDTKYNIFFKNDILKLSVRLKVENG